MIRFETASGSTYELDEKNRKIRRVTGMKTPQPRQGRDGDWKPYAAVTEVRIGYPMIISWDPETTPLHSDSPVGAMPATITSMVRDFEVVS